MTAASPLALYRELMDGKDGRLSFGKHMAVAVFWAYALGHPLPLVIAIALLLVSHGVKYLVAWLETKPVTATETFDLAKSIAEIRRRRDPVDGVEPTP